MTPHHHPRADLHIHSHYSDGTYTVPEIIERAKTLDLRVISITDHDSVKGIDEAKALTKSDNIEIVPGIEFSSELGDISVHLLGYFIDHHDAELLEYLSLCEKRRLIRTEKTVDELRELGYDITLEQILNIAEGGNLGRPHIAEALVQVSEFKSVQQVFRKLLVRGKPGYVEKPTFQVDEIINLVHSAGGICSLAHPKTVGDDTIIPKLVNRGLDAIEVVHSSHNLHDVEKYSALADQYNLVLSGGSDCHGKRLGREVIGKHTISTEQVERLRNRVPDTTVKNTTIDLQE
ncbi:MAG: PHP domain-containing protein [Candidatus Marinimicrobia bacterium]|nr:PHP domain-containing protein [Candidatus Neomarinimicrobiota bacterium]MCF7828995.1 PHP domain-containing protein [Candidatus Neomarinimicrobiota bacterium]MCF7879955.1 PHP domain-containing protein [Candidatus Neomarinimicrobiota bacterium]